MSEIKNTEKVNAIDKTSGFNNESIKASEVGKKLDANPNKFIENENPQKYKHEVAETTKSKNDSNHPQQDITSRPVQPLEQKLRSNKDPNGTWQDIVSRALQPLGQQPRNSKNRLGKSIENVSVTDKPAELNKESVETKKVNEIFDACSKEYVQNNEKKGFEHGVSGNGSKKGVTPETQLGNKEQDLKKESGKQLGNKSENIGSSENKGLEKKSENNGYSSGNTMSLLPREIADVLEKRYPGQVSSPTIPRRNARMVHMAGKRHPKSGIVYNLKGFPVFDDVAVFDTRIPSEIASIDKPTDHMKAATQSLDNYIKSLKDMGEKGKPQYNAIRSKFTPEQLNAIEKGMDRIPGFTWHHHEDFSRMQLVPRKKYHVKTGHVGGEHMRKQ